MGRVYSRMIQNRPEHATPLVRLLDPSRIIRSARDDRRETIMRAESRTTDLARFPPHAPTTRTRGQPPELGARVRARACVGNALGKRAGSAEGGERVSPAAVSRTQDVILIDV